MSIGSSHDAKERVREATDIVDLVGSYLSLRREGRNYKALCPWHDDQRPSLQVNPERQSFKCWVCDIGGDVFSFIMKMEGIEFREALAMLAERAGVAITPTGKKQNGSGASGSDAPDGKRLLFQAMQWVDEQFHHCLLNDPQAVPARRYFSERGLSSDTIKRFKLGFSPDQWDWLSQRARGTAYTPQVLERVGLVSRQKTGPGYYDRFKGRVLFPIFDAQARPVGLGGRVLPGAPADAAKYVNTPETPLFSKSNLLYGLNVARDPIRKSGTAIVMEGYTDCLMAQQFGFDNAVAVLGTALGEAHLRLLRRFAERVRIVLVLDGDEAGRKRANEVLELFVANNVDLRVATLPDDLDPCDFLLQRGADAFRAMVDGAIDALQHAFRVATQGIDIVRQPHDATRALEQLVATIAKAPRLRTDTSMDDRLREENFLKSLAAYFHLPEGELRGRMTELRRKSRGAASRPASTTDASSSLLELNSLEWELLETLLAAPETLVNLEDIDPVADLASEPCRQILLACRRLASQGVDVDFQRLLLEFDDPQVKNLLVEADEQGRAKEAADAPARASRLSDGFRRKREERIGRARTAALKDHHIEEDQALAILRQIEAQERARHGIAKPTDG